MASLVGKLARFAQSPQGRELTRKAAQRAKEFADKPENRQKVQDLRRRVTERVERRPGA